MNFARIVLLIFVSCPQDWFGTPSVFFTITYINDVGEKSCSFTHPLTNHDLKLRNHPGFKGV